MQLRKFLVVPSPDEVEMLHKHVQVSSSRQQMIAMEVEVEDKTVVAPPAGAENHNFHRALPHTHEKSRH